MAIDTTETEMTEKTRSNYVESFHLVQANSVVDQTGLSKSLPLALHICSSRVLQSDDRIASRSALAQSISDSRASAEHFASSLRRTRELLSAAFKPVSEIPKASFPPRGPQITSFDGPIKSIVEDTAPYVRSIVSYDIRLEARRLQLSSLLSQGGRNGKKSRTTRASRAALEGGHKTHTRRERWFPQHTNFSLVLQTGGHGWHDMAVQTESRGNSMVGSHDGSRRPSSGSSSSEA